MKIAVLMTCHNRKALTMQCLRLLSASWTLESGARNDGECIFDVFLNDDGCTDGTVEEVRKFASGARHDGFAIRIVKGSGSDYWARGMERAWQAAVGGGVAYDAYLWLNDDTMLCPTAVSTLLRAHEAHPEAVVCGTLLDSSGKPSYGLNVALGLAGNCVLVPAYVYGRVGMICGCYAHGWADYDYGLQVERAGCALVSAGVVGMAEGHDFRPSLKGLSFGARVKLLHDPKGWNVHDLWLLRKRNKNTLWAMASCLHMIGHVLAGER